ncbi:MAG TPA: hypothetical protein VMV37_06710 [Gammaproteobacteria bacterium]|nr:hypothetical protein [Gammaproteobacteria bacterium]
MLRRDDTDLAESWLDGTLARFTADNDDLVPQTRSLLSRIVGDAPSHARLANTLSMLEHIGSHKIMTTQHGADIDQPTLKHVHEEAGHAYFMKRQAEKTAGRPLDYVDDDLLAPAASRMYFQRLEVAMLRALGQRRSARAVYLYMSMIVEFRALWFYGLYQQTLQRAGHPLSLKRVLGEEQNHLGDVAERLETSGELSDARTAELVGYERLLFGRLLAAMQRAVA